MKKNVEKGDLLKTNPLEGFWVCSLVLGCRDETKESNAMCHVAVTNAVFDHDFDISQIDIENLRIIDTTNYENKVVPCIKIYVTKLKNDVEVIGQLDPSSYYNEALEFEIGNGSDGGWPQCGPLKKSIGYEAVHQWREVNNNESWLKDIASAEKSHTEMVERLKNER